MNIDFPSWLRTAARFIWPLLGLAGAYVVLSNPSTVGPAYNFGLVLLFITFIADGVLSTVRSFKVKISEAASRWIVLTEFGTLALAFLFMTISLVKLGGTDVLGYTLFPFFAIAILATNGPLSLSVNFDPNGYEEKPENP